MRKTFSSVLWAVVIVLAGTGLALAADPSPDQIYQALRAGNTAQAEQMVDQVLRDKPRSGRAHYVAAEVFARAGDLATARRELATAQSLEPGLPFAQPRAVQELESQLYGGTVAPRGAPSYAPGYAPAVRASSAPWGLIIVLIAAAAIVWMLVRRRRAMYYQGGYPGVPGAAPMGPGPYGPGPYPYGPAGAPGAGSGLLGSLGTGLAVGAGVAAGEELVRHAIDGRQGGEFIPSANAGEAPLAPPNADMGGQDFGLNDPGSWDDGGGGGDLGGGGGGDDWT